MKDTLLFIAFIVVSYVVLIFIYRKFLRRWNRLSGKSIPVARLPILDGDEVMCVYSENKGQNMTLSYYDETGNYVYQHGIVIPRKFKTPYQFINSGELDYKIRMGLALLESKRYDHLCIRSMQLNTDYKPRFDYDATSFYGLNLY